MFYHKLRGSMVPRLKAELGDLRRILVEVAVAKPGGADYEISDSGPSEVGGTVGPRCEIDFLIAFQFRTLWLGGDSFELNCSLVFPAHDEGARGVSDQVWVFSGGFYCVEDDFEVRSCSDAYQGGLGTLVWG